MPETLSEWVENRRRSASPSGLIIDRVTVNLEQYDHFVLLFVADRLGLSQATAGGDILRIALRQVFADFRPDETTGHPDADVPYPMDGPFSGLPMYSDEAAAEWDAEIKSQYRAWVQDGKGALRRSPTDISLVPDPAVEA